MLNAPLYRQILAWRSDPAFERCDHGDGSPGTRRLSVIDAGYRGIPMAKSPTQGVTALCGPALNRLRRVDRIELPAVIASSWKSHILHASRCTKPALRQKRESGTQTLRTPPRTIRASLIQHRHHALSIRRAARAVQFRSRSAVPGPALSYDARSECEINLDANDPALGALGVVSTVAMSAFILICPIN